MLNFLKDTLNSIKNIPEKLREEALEKKLEDFEIRMLKCNVAYEIVQEMKENLRRAISQKKSFEQVIRENLLDILNIERPNIERMIESKNSNGEPFLILLLGFNGSGKTTTAAKLAKKFYRFRPLFAAADTFRAASIEQLEYHGKALGVRVIKQKYGSDPAAVIFDSKQYAKTHNHGLIIADTAGRSYIDKNLMEELKKIIRVNKPDHRILVVDALIGNTAIDQAKNFLEIGFDSLIVSKVDSDEFGGSILSLAYVSKKPIIYLGNGQRYEDLEEFKAEEFVNKLLEGKP